MCSLHLTHPSSHTPGAVGGALLKGITRGHSRTSVVDNSYRSRDSNPQPRITSPTLYPLGNDCPLFVAPTWTVRDKNSTLKCPMDTQFRILVKSVDHLGVFLLLFYK